jgi:nucleoside-triphosphatase THEP1
LKVLEQNKVYTELDNIISVKEISDAIGSLENNKSRSFDSILNEMLKSSQTFIIEILHKLFNSILSNGSFPKNMGKGNNSSHI